MSSLLPLATTSSLAIARTSRRSSSSSAGAATQVAVENKLANAAQQGRLVACVIATLQRAALRHGRQAAGGSLCRVVTLQ
jgi:hypothetical protein